ncbi:MAG: hypothetical protein RLZZ488_1747 [Pseudomonadota bacterium]|jgi:Leucine-rich repeat (LRR) protein
MSVSAKTKLLACYLLPIVASLAACKPATESLSSSSSQNKAAEQAQTKNNGQAVQTAPAVRTLSAEDWLSKKNLNAEEERTVDAILDSMTMYHLNIEKTADLARWAARKLDHVDLSGKNLTNISPILAFKNISTLHLLGNKFTQRQIDELLKGLPKLKTLVTDEGLSCSANLKVTCLK